MAWKLQKGTVFTIRTTPKDRDEALDAGYTLLGECDENYNIIAPKADVGRRAREEPKGDEE